MIRPSRGALSASDPDGRADHRRIGARKGRNRAVRYGLYTQAISAGLIGAVYSGALVGMGVPVDCAILAFNEDKDIFGALDSESTDTSPEAPPAA